VQTKDQLEMTWFFKGWEEDVQKQRAYPLRYELDQIDIVYENWWLGYHASVSFGDRACPEVIHRCDL